MYSKIITALIVLMLSGASAFAQMNSNNCFPEYQNDKLDCNGFKTSKQIVIPQFPKCTVTVNITLNVCTDAATGKVSYFVHVESYDFADGDGCKELMNRINPNGNSFDEEFSKWFIKQCYYQTVLKVFKEMVESHPGEKYLCPNGITEFSGFMGSCNAWAVFSIPNRQCPNCPCCNITRFQLIDCTGSSCCIQKTKICWDKNGGPVITSDTQTAAPTQCTTANPEPVPGAIAYGKCFPLCTNEYPYNSDPPTK